MNNFESMGASAPSTKSAEQQNSGLEGICNKCEGQGKTRVGFFSTKQCGDCHGKGFVKPKPPTINNSYSWEKGVLH